MLRINKLKEKKEIKNQVVGIISYDFLYLIKYVISQGTNTLDSF